MRNIRTKSDLEIGKIYGIKGFKGVSRVKVCYFSENDSEIMFQVVDETCTKGLTSSFHECHLRSVLYQLSDIEYDKK